MNTRSVFSAIDLVPSLLKIAGVAKPADVEFDGVPLPDVLLGESEASRDRPLFYRRPPDRDGIFGVQGLPDLAMRDGRWKLLCEYDGTAPQLYDLETDRAETTNVAAQHPEIVQRLTAPLLAWHRSLPPDHGATFPATMKAGAAKKN